MEGRSAGGVELPRPAGWRDVQGRSDEQSGAAFRFVGIPEALEVFSHAFDAERDGGRQLARPAEGRDEIDGAGRLRRLRR